MINLKSIDDEDPLPAAETKGTESEYRFYFDGSKANLRTEPYNNCNIAVPPERADKNLAQRERFNDCTMKAIVKKIQDETKDDKRIRIFLIGHSSNEPVQAKSYLSNYELSEARAQNVKYEILQVFPDAEQWHNIEWSVLPASDELLPQVIRGTADRELFTNKELKDRFHRDDVSNLTSADIEGKFSAKEIADRLKPEEKRIVVVLIKPVSEHITTLQMTQIRENQNQYQYKPLKLMDYMYFSIYTITTTGYGDIVPTTAYAKFVTSLANICEVLFLVVFFNALISIKQDKNEDELMEVLRNLKSDKDHEDETRGKGNVTSFRQ
jgi:hypothetical protein